MPLISIISILVAILLSWSSLSHHKISIVFPSQSLVALSIAAGFSLICEMLVAFGIIDIALSVWVIIIAHEIIIIIPIIEVLVILVPLLDSF